MKNETTYANNSTNNVQILITTISMNIASQSVNTNQFFIGIFLALLSSLFIGSSFILKKKGLLKLINDNDSVRAGSGGFGYLCEIQWWFGLAIMGLGELCNFAAYGFAPASVVTPLGALSVLVSALMAVRFLNEKLNIFGKIGCLLTVFGSIIIIIHAPKESEINSLLDFARKVGAPEFLFFSSLICIAILLLIIYYGPRFGSKYIHVYILICSLLSAFTITACKGLSAGLKEIFTHQHTYSIWLTFICAITIIICILIQMIYLNRALDLFATPVVTTVYYVLFTTCVLITSGILFREWHLLKFVDIIACLVGFSITTCGLILINYLKTNTLVNEIQSGNMNGIKTSRKKNFSIRHCFIHLTESLFYFFTANSQLSSDSSQVNSVKQYKYLPMKSYANLLLDDNELPLSMNSINEQYQPMLLIGDCDLKS